MATKVIFIALSLLYLHSVPGQVHQAEIEGATIHYVDAGKGDPVVFIHAGLEDYRMWDPVMQLMDDEYRVIAISRRYNYPNTNRARVANFSAETEADDIAAFVRKLDLKSVHIVGHAFGGLAALTFAKKYPELTKSITISEVPLVSWLKEIEGGQELYDQFHNMYWRPLQIAFDLRDTADVFRHTFNYFYGENIYPTMPTDLKERLLANLTEWEMMTEAPMVITPVTKEDVKGLKVPVMIVTTDKSFKTLQKTNAELITCLPNATRIQLKGANFDMWSTHAAELSNSMRAFYNR
jgi:pimeloyl-ACP methyl ester carboxylesterase